MNYHELLTLFHFRKLYQTAPRMGKHLIDIFADKLRKKALKMLTKSHSPTTLPVNYLMNVLGYTKDADAQFMEFLSKNKVILCDDNVHMIDCKKTYQQIVDEEQNANNQTTSKQQQQ